MSFRKFEKLYLVELDCGQDGSVWRLVPFSKLSGFLPGVLDEFDK